MIVEDEFYLAMEMQDEIVNAGGAVIGPFAHHDAALIALDSTDADFALVDINLGNGPSYIMADALQAKGVPFIFLTGYDGSSIPARFDEVPRVHKPAHVAKLLQSVEQYLAR